MQSSIEEFDVAIVGAGPAGSVAATDLAKKGISVVVFERGVAAGDKNVSGCALSPKVWRDFAFMAEMNLPYRRSEMATIHFVGNDNREKTSVSFSPPESNKLTYPEAQQFLTINVYRRDFDRWLAARAAKAGATICYSTLITDLLKDPQGQIQGVILEDGTSVGANIVLGADGVISTVAKAAGLRDRWQPSELAWMTQYHYHAPKEKIDQIIGSNALHYWYSATFPVGYTFFNVDGFHVGLGSILSMVNKRYNPRILLDKLLGVEGVARQIELVGGTPVEFQAHMFPMIEKPKNLVTDGVMILGDAGGLACPLEAEGVYYAMLSGQIAASVAEEALAQKNFSKTFLSTYETRIRTSHIGEEFDIGPSIGGFVQHMAFNMDAGKWVVPFMNAALYSIANVADAHSTNIRLVEPRIKEYLPPLLDALEKDLGPVAEEALAPRPPKKQRRLGFLTQKLGGLLLPPIARLFGRQIGYPTLGLTAFLVKNFMRPLLDARYALPFAAEQEYEKRLKASKSGAGSEPRSNKGQEASDP